MHSRTMDDADRSDHVHFIPAAAAREPAQGAALARAIPVEMEVHYDIGPIEPRWRALEQAAACPVHQTYDWCRAWIDATAARPVVIIGRIGGIDALLLPLETVRRGGFSVLRYIGAPFSNINFGIFTGSACSVLAETGATRRLVDDIRALGVGADCIILDKMPLEWRGLHHPLASLAHIENQNEAYQITLDPCFEKVIGRTNAKRKRKKFRLSTRRLDEAGGWEHVTAETPAEALAMLDTFFAQKAERLKARGLRDVFAPETTRDFFRKLAADCDGDPRRPRQLQLHAIRLKGPNDGILPAIAGVSIKGDHLICQFASIDGRLWGEASPGELLFHLMIEKACGNGVALFDFGIGDERYKRSWCDVATKHYDFVLPLTLRGRSYAAAYRAAVAAKRFVKRNPRVFGVANRIRAFRRPAPDRSD